MACSRASRSFSSRYSMVSVGIGGPFETTRISWSSLIPPGDAKIERGTLRRLSGRGVRGGMEGEELRCPPLLLPSPPPMPPAPETACVTFADIVASTPPEALAIRTRAEGPAGALPLSDEMLRRWPSGDLFGLSQNAGMGWAATEVDRDPFLILSTQGGLRAPDGTPIALGYHTGHWEIGLLVQEGAEELRRLGVAPFAGMVSDPCDGRTQGTTGMMDSLPYRNDAAIVFRRLIRSLPRRKGVLGVATCDKGLPAMMLALAGCGRLPGVIVPGGVTLPPREGEDAGKIQSIGARYSHGELSLAEAAELGCRACGSPGGGCQFLGTAATSQVVAEALGLTVPHAALAPSGQPIWLDTARRSALALIGLAER